MSAPDLRPKQKRSQATHDKFLKSLQNLLQSKYFEHISIKELAEGAGVSVGTFYRRFENKEALLPLMYDAFGKELEQWIEEMESIECDSLEQQVNILCQSTYTFLEARKSVFRTIHLNARLHSDTIFANPTLDRNVAYSRLSRLLLRYSTDKSNNLMPHEADPFKEQAAGMAIYMLINGLLDKILYPSLTPAIACTMSQAAFVEQLPTMLLNYLKPCLIENQLS